MYRFLTLLFALLFPIFLFGQNNFDSLLNELDQTVADSQLYSNKKEDEINKLKGLLKYTVADLQKYAIYGKLYAEYKLYQSDSALIAMYGIDSSLDIDLNFRDKTMGFSSSCRPFMSGYTCGRLQHTASRRWQSSKKALPSCVSDKRRVVRTISFTPKRSSRASRPWASAARLPGA